MARVSKIDVSKQPPRLLLAGDQPYVIPSSTSLSASNIKTDVGEVSQWNILSIDSLTMTVERTNRSGIKQTGSIHLSNAIDSSIDTDDVSKLTQGSSKTEMPPLFDKKQTTTFCLFDDIARGADVNDPRHPFHHAKEGAQVKAVAIGANMKTRMVILSLVEPLIGCEEENENSGKGRKKRKGDKKLLLPPLYPSPHWYSGVVLAL